MLNLVSLYVVFNMVGVGGQMAKFNIKVYGQLYEILVQSSPKSNTRSALDLNLDNAFGRNDHDSTAFFMLFYKGMPSTVV